MIRRVLICPLNYDHYQAGLVHAFRGIFGDGNACVFDFLHQQRAGKANAQINDNLFWTAIANGERPAFDWIWIQAQETEVITAETLERIRQVCPETVITHWTGDMRETISPYLASICKATHATLASSLGQLGAFMAAGAPRVGYCQIGVDWEEDVLGLPAWEPPFRVPDVVFCGNYYGDRFPDGSAERLWAIRALTDAGIDVGVVGSGWPAGIPVVGTCTVKQQHHVYRRAKVALSISHFSNVERYYSDRQLIAMASGTPVVSRWIPGMDEEFEFADRTPTSYGDPCLWYYGSDDRMGLCDAIRSLLDNPDLARSVGAAGRAEVIRRHTWFSRILDVLPLIEEIRCTLRTPAG